MQPMNHATDLGTHFVQTSLIERNPHQPRTHFDEVKLQELADSIRDHGLLQPITVRKIAEDRYVVIAGERRWRAHKLLGAETTHARILECNDQVAYELSLLENLKRDDLNLLEEARGLLHLKTEFGYSLEQLKVVVGKSPSSISNIMSILKEDPKVQAYVQEGTLTLAAWVVMKALPNTFEKLELLRKLENEEIKRTNVKDYVKKIKEAYAIAEKLGISPEDVLKKPSPVGKQGRFDLKGNIIPEDFNFFFILDNLIGSEDLQFFPRRNVLISAFPYICEKSSSKRLAQLLFGRETIELLMVDSGAFSAAQRGQWDFFDKNESLFDFYESVEPDICVGLDVPAYSKVMNEWGLTPNEIIEKTLENAAPFRDWKPKFETTKVYTLQGITAEDYLKCFRGYVDLGVFDTDEKVAIAFGSIARSKIEDIVNKVSLTLNDYEFQELYSIGGFEFTHYLGIGQPQRLVKLYSITPGRTHADALTTIIVTATGQYWLRGEFGSNGKYISHIVPESSLMRRIRLYFNVNSFWNILTECFAKHQGMTQKDTANALRGDLDKQIDKIELLQLKEREKGE